MQFERWSWSSGQEWQKSLNFILGQSTRLPLVSRRCYCCCHWGFSHIVHSVLSPHSVTVLTLWGYTVWYFLQPTNLNKIILTLWNPHFGEWKARGRGIVACMGWHCNVLWGGVWSSLSYILCAWEKTDQSKLCQRFLLSFTNFNVCLCVSVYVCVCVSVYGDIYRIFWTTSHTFFHSLAGHASYTRVRLIY